MIENKHVRYERKRIKKIIAFRLDNERDQKLIKVWNSLPNATEFIKNKLEEKAKE